MRQFLILLILFLEFLFSASAQSTFQKTFGNPFVNDIGQSILQSADGGFVIAGTQFAPGNNFESLFLVRTNNLGDTLWIRLINESFNKYTCGSIKQTFDGGFIIAGNKGNASLSNPYLIKTDSSGIPLWSKSYEIAGMEHIYAVLQLADSGYLAAGYLYNGNNIVYFIRTNTVGDTLWTKSYGENNYNASVYSVCRAADGGFAAAGSIQNTTTQDVDAFLFKTDSIGNVLWAKGYGETGYDYTQQVISTNDGGFALAAVTYSFGAGLADYYLIKTDSLGDEQWSKTYGGTSDDRSESVLQTNDGGFVISGESASFSSGNFDGMFVRTNANGDTLMTSSVSSVQSNEAYSIIQTTNGGFAVTGNYLNASGNNDIFLLNTDSVFNMGCNGQRTPSTATTPATITSNHHFSVYPPGTMVLVPPLLNVTGGTLPTTICILDQVNEENPGNSILLFPNPAEKSLQIVSNQFHIASVVIYSAPGDKILESTVVDGREITLDIQSFPAGIYFICVRTEKEEKFLKLIKQ